ncbi:MAG: ATP-binding cassette domain-containing protein [Holophagaceae bacterium]|nr:ATP-binding cassette domain-containing protein [Holophagaceae bacterium]
MAEAALLIGMPGNLALWRLLGLRGVTMPLQSLEETLLWDFSLDGMVEELRGRGFQARAVQVQAEELDHLELPTLVQAQTGDWVVLRKRAPGGYLLEQGMGGVEFASLELLDSALAGPALDLSEPLPERGGLWARMLQLLPRHRAELAQAAAAAVVLQGLALVSPWLTGKAIDQALPQAAGGLLVILSLGLLLAAFFRAWVGWLRDATLLAFATRFEAALEKGLLEHLLWLPFKDLQQKTVGEHLQAFTGLTMARSQILNRGVGVLLGAFTGLAYLVWMFISLPGLAAVVALVALIMGLLSLLAGRLQARVQVREVEASQAQRSALVEMLRGIPTLKATGSQAWAFTRWGRRLDEGLARGLERERLELWNEVVQSLLGQGLNAAILIYGGREVLAGHLSLGSLMAFVQLAAGFQGSVSSLAGAAVAFIAMRPQLAEVEKVFSAEPEPRPPRKGPLDLPGPLALEDVWFRYSGDTPWVLQGLSLQVHPGAFHHLPGPSGSGKSTLLKIIAGLYPADRGSVSLGGLDPRAASRFMVYLPQFPQLLSGSLMENLKLFSGGATQKRLQEVAEETGLAAWVATLPMGYQTIVASGGTNLSGGQRQLIAITAILASSKKLLLLDEALSNLDWVSRARIIRSPRFAGRTVVYASHEEILLR